MLGRYLKPDLLIIDDMWMKPLPGRRVRVPAGDHHAPPREPLDADDQRPPAGRLGQAD
jgi:hypothetical protein